MSHAFSFDEILSFIEDRKCERVPEINIGEVLPETSEYSICLYVLEYVLGNKK